MGLSAFWSQLTGPRVKEIAPTTSSNFEQRRPGTSSSVHKARKYNSEPNVISEAILTQPTINTEGAKLRRKSRGPQLTKQKSEGNLKKRRSWFGARPGADDDVPLVPTLPPLGHERNRHMADTPAGDLARPGTALTTDEQISWSRPATPEAPEPLQKRKSIFGRKRSQSSSSQTKAKKRQSWFGGRADDDEAPPMPAMPMPILSKPSTNVEQPNTQRDAATAQENEQRKSRRLSFGRRSRSKSDVSVKRKSKPWFTSSNPDDSAGEQDPPMPPMPALVQDDLTTPDSSVATTRTPDQANFIDPNIFSDSPIRSFMAEDPMRTVTRGNSIKQPRPISGVSLSSQKRKSYVPKNAANGFLKSTASQRASQRHSLLDDGEGGMICLNDEQQKEWDKLKHLMEVMENRQGKHTVGHVPFATQKLTIFSAADDGVIGMLRELEEEEHKGSRAMYKNDDALAALEFGVAR